MNDTAARGRLDSPQLRQLGLPRRIDLRSDATEVMNVIMKRTKTTKQSAAACYAERQTECRDLLKRIASQLDRHAARQAQAPSDWGYPGDLGRVTEELAHVLASLGDLSAVDEKGLEY
jgi:hypothetical protein